jgi:4'-phosphopantetheinyl transferase
MINNDTKTLQRYAPVGLPMLAEPIDQMSRWAPGEVHIWCVRLDSDPESLQHAHQRLSPEERSRAARFLVDQPRNTFVLSRAVLRTLLAGLTGTAACDLKFSYTKQGKPLLADGLSSAPHFNVSHSGDFATYAVMLGCEVGIDIEKHRLMPDMEAIAQRFFSPREYQSLSQVPESDRISAFFDCWVRKEAYIKARGGGLAMGLDKFQVSFAPGEPVALLAIEEPGQNPQEWFLHAFTVAPGYSAAVALRQKQCRVQLHKTECASNLLQSRGEPRP